MLRVEEKEPPRIEDCSKKQKEPAEIEIALNQLDEAINTNKRISQRLYDQVFVLGPVGNITPEPDQNSTLGQVIYQYIERINETNDRLDDVYKCLSRQLGSIKLN